IVFCSKQNPPNILVYYQNTNNSLKLQSFSVSVYIYGTKLSSILQGYPNNYIFNLISTLGARFHHRHKRDICSHFPLVVFTVSSLHSKAQVRHLFILPFGHIHSVFFALQSTSATSVHTSLWSYSQCLLCRSAAAKPFDAQ